MRSTVSLRFVAVVFLASLALAGQHANAGSSRAAKSFTANRPSGQRSYRPTTFKTGSAKLGSNAAGSSSLKKLSGNPLTIKNPIVGTTPVNARFPGKPFPGTADKHKIQVDKLPGWTAKLPAHPGRPYCPPGKPWCGWKPAHCWWWFDYCRPLRTCHVNNYCYYDWNYVTCDYYVAGRPVAVNARWYLGVKGMVLPGKGLGIEEVDANSPAAAAGLAPGMVIVRCNGIELTDDQAVNRAIRASTNGLVQMDVRTADGAEPTPVAVQMIRLASVSY